MPEQQVSVVWRAAEKVVKIAVAGQPLYVTPRYDTVSFPRNRSEKCELNPASMRQSLGHSKVALAGAELQGSYSQTQRYRHESTVERPGFELPGDSNIVLFWVGSGLMVEGSIISDPKRNYIRVFGYLLVAVLAGQGWLMR